MFPGTNPRAFLAARVRGGGSRNSSRSLRHAPPCFPAPQFVPPISAVSALCESTAVTLAGVDIPIVQELQAAGCESLRAIAAGLGERGIPAARGGKWSAVQVSRLLEASAIPFQVANVGAA
jgi:Recombinase